MNTYQDYSLWIEIAVIILVGGILLALFSKAARILARKTNLEPIAARRVGALLRWIGILVILGLLVNKLFGIDLMGVILGGLALVAIGVVAVWSMLSHITATLLLVVLKPFQVGHWIGFPGEEVAGRVIDFNLFYTHLENEDTGEHFIIPNNQFFQKPIRHTPGKGRGKGELSEQFAQSGSEDPSTEA